MDKMTTDWKVVEMNYAEDFPKNIIPLLICNELGAIRITNFYSESELSSIVQNIMKEGIAWYPNFEFNQGRIGLCATEYQSKLNGKQAYFALEPENSAIKNRIFNKDIEPIQRMVAYFSKNYSVSIAEEPHSHTKYFTGLIRAMQHKSTTHFDFAPHQLPGWWVSGIESQLSAVIYLRVPKAEGALTIFNRQWNLSDDSNNKDINEKGPKGFDSSFLVHEKSVTIHPTPGEIVIFNSRNFHRVENISSQSIRLSVNTFVGVKNGKLFLWD